jgi:hypothetical protein
MRSAMIVVRDDFFKADLCNLIAKGTEKYQWSYLRAVENDPTDRNYKTCATTLR